MKFFITINSDIVVLIGIVYDSNKKSRVHENFVHYSPYKYLS